MYRDITKFVWAWNGEIIYHDRGFLAVCWWAKYTLEKQITSFKSDVSCLIGCRKGVREWLMRVKMRYNQTCCLLVSFSRSQSFISAELLEGSI